MIKLDKDTKKMLENMLKSDKPKMETFKSTGISSVYLNRLIDEYTEEIDKDYKNKLKKVFETNRLNKMKKTKLESTIDENSHPIAKIRLERNISNRDIARLSRGRIKNEHLCDIQNGKIKPTLVTKIKIAETLKVSVKDIFPEEAEFGEIYTWNDYWFNIRNVVIKAIKDYYKEEQEKGHNKIMTTLAEITGIKVDRLYTLKAGMTMVNNNDYKKLKEHNIIREDI